MAIRMMVSKEEYEKNPENIEVVTDYPAAEGRTLYMRTSHVGLVLETRERNYYDDSDFYAIVWNTEENEPENVEYASTRGWSYPNGALEDATKEIVEKYTAWKAIKRAELEKLAAERKAKTVEKYKEVKVVHGRKIPIGTSGRVFWIGNNGYGMSVGLELNSGLRVFTSLNNVEVVLPTGV